MAISKPKILLTHSYFLRFDPKEHRAMMPYPPLGTLYAGSVLRQSGYSVNLFDSMLAHSEEDIVDFLQGDRPSIVVIYDDDFNYLTKMCLTRMRQAALRMTSIAKERDCTVVLHGSDPVDHLATYFDGGVDYVVCGEGEKTLVELVDFLAGGAPPRQSIAGLAYREHGTIVRNTERVVEKNLDAFPFPAWDLIAWPRYRDAWTSRHGYFSVNMVTTRGCPFHCNWCAKPLYGQVYSTRTPFNVVEEMLMLRKKVKPDHLWFCDDIFGLKPGWIPEFSQEVVRHDAFIPFKCLSRVDLLLKENAIEHLRTSGCQTVWVGAESGSQKILDAMEKGTTVEQIYEATKKLHHAGIQVGFFLQYGYPGEERNDIELTLQMVKDCKPDEIGISVSYPLPGTKFYNRVETELGDKQNWVNSEDLDIMFQGEFVPDFYRVLHKITHKRFRIWQGFDFLKAILMDPLSLSLPRLRRIASIGYHAATLPTLTSKLNALARNRSLQPNQH